MCAPLSIFFPSPSLPFLATSRIEPLLMLTPDGRPTNNHPLFPSPPPPSASVETNNIEEARREKKKQEKSNHLHMSAFVCVWKTALHHHQQHHCNTHPPPRSLEEKRAINPNETPCTTCVVYVHAPTWYDDAPCVCLCLGMCVEVFIFLAGRDV